MKCLVLTVDLTPFTKTKNVFFLSGPKDLGPGSICIKAICRKIAGLLHKLKFRRKRLSLSKSKSTSQENHETQWQKVLEKNLIP